MKFKIWPWKSILAICTLVVFLFFTPDFLFSQTTTPTTTQPIQQVTLPATPTPSKPARALTPKEKKAAEAAAAAAAAALEKQQDLASTQRPSLITQAMLLSLLSLLPFIIMILTSFLKIVVVLSLLRTALGVQQAPPNQVINGVAFLLSLFIMYPTALKMYDAGYAAVRMERAPESLTSPGAPDYIITVAKAASDPLKDFLKKNTNAKHEALFYRLAYRGLPEEYRSTLSPNDFLVLVPSYITGQLTDAFQIGVLIYIPFFVIDLVTSNILLAMGMMMLSPVTISMPLKLFLLVMLDGWTVLIEGLVKTFIT